MIYTIDNNKNYGLGKRETEQFFLNIVDIREYHLESGNFFHSKVTSNKILLLVTSGSIAISNNEIKKGNVVYISKYSHYKFSAITTANVIEILFEYSNDRILLFKENLRTFKAPLETIEYIKKIYYNRLYTNMLSGVNEALLLNIINMLNILCDSYSANLGLYQKFCEWLESSNYTTAEQASVAMGCTIAHLNRTVKKYSNKCLSTLINERMISKIEMLIRYSNYSTKEIALTLGFSSPELLRKFFKYHTGISLKDYKSGLI